MLWEDNYLAHFGIKGQKWGIRRFQNEDGTLTDAGKKRYQKENYRRLEKLSKDSGVGYGNSFYMKGREILPKKKMEELAKLTKEHDEKTKNMAESDPRRDEDYLKKGGVHDKVEEIIDETLGKYKNRFSKIELRRLVEWAADDVQNERFKKMTSDEKEKLYSEGRKEAQHDYDALDSIKDPDEKAKQTEKLLKKAFDSLGPYADSTHPGYDENGDPKSQAYDIQICAEFDRKIKRMWDPLYLRGGDYEKSPPEISKLKDRIEANQGTQSEMYRETVHQYKDQNHLEKLRSDDVYKIEKIFSDNSKVKKLREEVNNIQDKQIPEQICKEIGIPATPQNIQRIYPFIWYDPFDDNDRW